MRQPRQSVPSTRSGTRMAASSGGNTDVPGYLANLDEQAPGLGRGGRTAVVLGAGGAASSIVHGLLDRGLRVAVVNRTFAHAEALVARFGSRVSAHSPADLPRLLESASLLTNTTLLGAAGQPSLDIDLATLDRRAVVCDIVYVPLETELLQDRATVAATGPWTASACCCTRRFRPLPAGSGSCRASPRTCGRCSRPTSALPARTPDAAARSDRLDRHGQIDHRAVFRRGRRAGPRRRRGGPSLL